MSVTFTKLFSSITESTIWCEDSDIRIVWITMLAMCDRHGRVFASIPGLANRAQVDLTKAETAIEKFLSPDKYSRTTDHEGRRIEPIDGGWRLLNHSKYREIRDEEERKAYKREWIREKRKSEKNVDNVDNVDKSRHESTHTDTDTDTDTKTIKKAKIRFCPPSLEEISQYCETRRNNVDPHRFHDFYSAKGWMVGRNKMKDWKAAVRTWEKRDKPEQTDLDGVI